VRTVVKANRINDPINNIKNEFMAIAVKHHPRQVAVAAFYVAFVAISMRRNTVMEAVDEFRESIPQLEDLIRHIFPKVLDQRLSRRRKRC
jgi:hypothetical protein